MTGWLKATRMVVLPVPPEPDWQAASNDAVTIIVATAASRR